MGSLIGTPKSGASPVHQHQEISSWSTIITAFVLLEKRGSFLPLSAIHMDLLRRMDMALRHCARTLFCWDKLKSSQTTLSGSPSAIEITRIYPFRNTEGQRISPWSRILQKTLFCNSWIRWYTHASDPQLHGKKDQLATVQQTWECHNITSLLRRQSSTSKTFLVGESEITDTVD